MGQGKVQVGVVPWTMKRITLRMPGTGRGHACRMLYTGLERARRRRRAAHGLDLTWKVTTPTVTQ